MGLVSLATIEPLFACPRCRARLERSEQGYNCSSAACAFNPPGSFRVEREAPILVDFEQSILRREDAAGEANLSPLVAPRWSVARLPRRLRSLWKPVNTVAERNV